MSTAITSKRDAWRLAARPKTLPASIVGSAVAIADHQFAPLAAIAIRRLSQTTGRAMHSLWAATANLLFAGSVLR